MKKIKKGDEVVVISGKDKGKIGRVSKVTDSRLIVDGVNKVKKHLKANPATDTAGGIADREMSIHVSNVALKVPGVDGAKKTSKVGVKLLDGKRVRYFRSNGELVDR